MLTDIEIAKQADIKPISDIAEKLGISADELEFYGKYKAKLPLSLLKKYENKEDGKLKRFRFRLKPELMAPHA